MGSVISQTEIPKNIFESFENIDEVESEITDEIDSYVPIKTKDGTFRCSYCSRDFRKNLKYKCKVCSISYYDKK